MLDKILGAFKAKNKPAQEEEQKPMDEGQPEAVKPAVDPAKVAVRGNLLR